MLIKASGVLLPESIFVFGQKTKYCQMIYYKYFDLTMVLGEKLGDYKSFYDSSSGMKMFQL